METIVVYSLAQQSLEHVSAITRVYMRQCGCALVRPCSWVGFDQVSNVSALPHAAGIRDTKPTDYSPRSSRRVIMHALYIRELARPTAWPMHSTLRSIAYPPPHPPMLTHRPSRARYLTPPDQRAVFKCPTHLTQCLVDAFS